MSDMQSVPPPRRQLDHKAMRMVVGTMALLLSPMVWLFARRELTSISISYWTDARDLFVGTLVAIAFFLSAYNGAGEERDAEFWLSKAACGFALLVALFPTTGFEPTAGAVPADAYEPAWWVTSVASLFFLEVVTIHVGAAILLFGCLVALMFFFSLRALKKGKPRRAWAYRVIGLLIVLGIVVGFVAAKVWDVEGAVFWLEAWALTLFGIGWFLAGAYKTEVPSPTTPPQLQADAGSE